MPILNGLSTPELAKLRAETGRPHWIVLDEAHHRVPAKWDASAGRLPRELPAAICRYRPSRGSRARFFDALSTVVGVGEGAQRALAKFCEATGRAKLPALDGVPAGQVIVLDRNGKLELVTALMPKEKQNRHLRKYAEGDLGEDKSFYFRGPEGALNLRARNLSAFLQLAVGVDEKTWLHHLREGAYSRWFRDAIKDQELAAEAAAVECDESLPLGKQSRAIHGARRTPLYRAG